MNLGMENEYLEFKRSTSELKEAMLSICAILNKHQKGELYFGVKNDGTVIGQMVTEDTLRDISQRIKTSIEPRIYADVKLVELDGKSCVYVSFEGMDTPYFANGIAKIRMSDEDITISPMKLSEMYRKKYTQFGVWELLVSKKTINDIDEDLLNRYILQAKNAGRIAIDFTNKETVLNQLELVEGKFLLNAGKVLFSSEITQDLQMAIFASTERLTFNDIQRYHGPILKLVDIAENYIKNNIHWGVEFDGAMQRKEVPEIPINAIREALLNSFCHKDFSVGESNEVAIYKD
nr:putative DNA binding domain-containing protein [Anaeroplasmataceae bacterium]